MSPSRSISARSMCMWMSSSSTRKRELPLLNFPADVRQGLLNLKAFVGGEQPDLGEHLGVGDRGFDILSVQPPVEAHAFGELLDAAVRGLIEDPAPCLFSHGIPSAW